MGDSREALSDEQIDRRILDALRAIGRHDAWDALTYESGPYSISRVKEWGTQLARAILAERGPGAVVEPPALPQCVLDLIAVVNGDGGHYLDEHGLEEACKCGEERYLEGRAALETGAVVEPPEPGKGTWEAIFGHLGTPDEVGNLWHALTERAEKAERMEQLVTKQLDTLLAELYTVPFVTGGKK